MYFKRDVYNLICVTMILHNITADLMLSEYDLGELALKEDVQVLYLYVFGYRTIPRDLYVSFYNYLLTFRCLRLHIGEILFFFST